MRLVALAVLLIGNILANQAQAEDVSTQPLTRVNCDKAEMAWDEQANLCGVSQPLTRDDCGKAGMAWNDNANVCEAAPQAAEGMPEVQSEVANTAGQPLTRDDCGNAGMAWNDNANVCEAAPQAAEGMPEVQSEVANTAGQPLTRDDCGNAGMAWNDNANVCEAAPQAAEGMPEVQSEVANTAGQPLTRDDCGNAGMVWNDNANVCEAAPQAAEGMPEVQSEVANTAGQPLTRDDCGNAGMAWNDNANVCGEKAEVSATPAASEETNPIESSVLINIDKAGQKMTVLVDGVQQYEWPVSTGLSGYTTPSGAYTARSMNEIWYSRQWDDAPMPHAVFFTKDGHAIHGTYEVKRLGKPASHGCVRLSRENAATLYALVAKTGLKNTQVLLAGLTPGGEGKVASSKRPKSSYRRGQYYANSFPQRPRRGGLFRRLFGGR